MQKVTAVSKKGRAFSFLSKFWFMETSVYVLPSYVKVKRTGKSLYTVYYGCCKEISHFLYLLNTQNPGPGQNCKLRKCCTHITDAERSWNSKISRLKTIHHTTAELLAWLSTLGGRPLLQPELQKFT